MENRRSLSVFDIPILGATWAGEFPSEKGFCVGSEDGEVWVSGADRSFLKYPPEFKMDEAINGVAFAKELMAVSTPGEIRLNRFHDTKEVEVERFDGGAHGIVATKGGGVVAPRGGAGLLLFDPLPGGLYHQRAIRTQADDVYFYRVVSLGTTGAGEDLFACAARESGVLVVRLAPGRGAGPITAYRGRESPRIDAWDIIDICPIDSAGHPFALAGLGIDNSLHLFRDISGGPGPVTLEFPELEGTGYSVFSAQGHIFILTSKALYLLQGLADRFLRDEKLIVPSRLRSLDMDAVDGTLAYGKTLLIVLADSVLCIEVGAFARDEEERESPTDRNGTEVSPREFESMPAIGSDPWELTSVAPLDLVGV